MDEAQGGVSEWLRVTDGGRLVAAAEDVFRASLDFVEQSGGSASVYVGELRQAQESMMAPVEAAADRVALVADEVRRANIPETEWQGILQGAGRAASYRTPEGIAALGGVALGGLILPGIGHVVGGALGAAMAGQFVDQQRNDLFERYDEATERASGAIARLAMDVWDRAFGRAGWPRAEDLNRAMDSWNQLLEEMESSNDDFVGRVKAFAAEHGHPPMVVRTLVMTQLGWPDRVGPYLALGQRLYPEEPTTWEAAADAAVAIGEPEAALQHAARGLQLHPGYRDLLVTKIEALAMLARLDDAVGVVRSLNDDSHLPVYFLVRGLARTDREAELRDVIRRWVDEAGLAIVSRILSNDPVTAHLPGRADLGLPAARHLDKEGVVAEWLEVDGEDTFAGLPPDRNRANKVKDWLRPTRRERILWYYDWTTWGSGKGGILISTRRIAWKSLWEDPVSHFLEHLSPEDVVGEGAVIRVKGDEVSTGEDGLGELIAGALRELVATHM